MSKEIVIGIGADVTVDNVDLKKLESGIKKSMKQVRKELETGGISSDVAKQLNQDLKKSNKILRTLTGLNTAQQNVLKLQAQYNQKDFNQKSKNTEKARRKELFAKKIEEQENIKKLKKRLLLKREATIAEQDLIDKKSKKRNEEKKSSWFGGGFDGGLGVRSSLGGKVLPYGAGGLAGASFVWGTMASEYFQRLLALQAKSNSSVENLQKFALTLSERTGGMMSRTGSLEFVSTFASRLQKMFIEGGELAKHLARIGVSDVDPDKPIDALMKILLSASKVQGADAKAFRSQVLKDLGFSDQMMRIVTSPEEYAQFYGDFQKQSVLSLDELKEIAEIQQTQTAALNKLYAVLEKIYATLSKYIINPILEFGTKGVGELLATIAGILATIYGGKKLYSGFKKVSNKPSNKVMSGVGKTLKTVGTGAAIYTAGQLVSNSMSDEKDKELVEDITNAAMGAYMGAKIGAFAGPVGMAVGTALGGAGGYFLDDIAQLMQTNNNNNATINNTYNVTSTDPKEAAQEIAAIKQQEELGFNPAFAGNY